MFVCVKRKPTSVIVPEQVERDTSRSLVLLAVRCSSRKEERSPQYIALTRDPILELRQYSHAVSIFAERVGGTPEAAESFPPTSSVVIDKNAL